MKFRFLMVFALIATVFVTAGAQEAQTTNTVSFNDVSFSFPSSLATHVTIGQAAATDPSEPLDVDAAHTEFVLYGDDMESATALTAPSVIRVYRTADLTDVENIASQYQQLQTLLTQRDDLATYTTGDPEGTQLPFLPVQNAGQVLRARAQYIDTATLQGVSYVTAYRQDVSGLTSGDVTYTFQGLSLDGSTYVSAVFHLTTDLFPTEDTTEFDATTYPAYLTESVQQLNDADPTAFTPSLSDIEAVIQSISVGGSVMVPPASTVVAPAVTATATEVAQDATLGGLAGTWTLVSYGAAEAQQQALASTPVTLTFSPNGIEGSAGCNTYGGAFQYNAGALTFTNVASTLMACADDIMAQETAFLSALPAVTAFQINGSQLVLTYSGGVLTFVNAAAVPTATGDATITATAIPTEAATVTATVTPGT